MSEAAADAILLLHAGFVLFVVGGLLAIWWGIALGKPFARDRRFRGLHLAAIAFVVIETLLGYMCPLTVWESALRGETSDRAFIARFVHAWLYWDWPPWVFNAIYVSFAALAAWTWWRFPPK